MALFDLYGTFSTGFTLLRNSDVTMRLCMTLCGNSSCHFGYNVRSNRKTFFITDDQEMLLFDGRDSASSLTASRYNAVGRGHPPNERRRTQKSIVSVGSIPDL